MSLISAILFSVSLSAVTSQIISESRKILNYTTVDTVSTIRKEVRDLSTSELSSYFSALWTYKNIGRQDGKSHFKTYDDLVGHHAMATVNSTADQAHEYGAFMVWHSLIVRELEIALQSIDPTVSIPYWDWTLDSSVGAKSAIFTSKYFGASGGSKLDYAVIDSLMAYWPVSSSPLNYVTWASPKGFLRGPTNSNACPYVSRSVGTLNANLPTIAEYTECLLYSQFNQFWSCVWGTAGSMEDQSNIHSGVHKFGGGTWDSGATGDLTDPITSPNDPLWFSHHAQLERLYYTWRQRSGDSLATSDDPCGSFYGNLVTNPQPAGHNLNDVFYPYFYLEGDTPLTIAQGCAYLNTKVVPYTYA